MAFEQLDLFPKEEKPDTKIEKVLTDEDLAERAIALYSSGEKSSIPEALVTVFGNENIRYDDGRFNAVKALAERILVKKESGRKNKVVEMRPRKPNPLTENYDYKKRQANDI